MLSKTERSAIARAWKDRAVLTDGRSMPGRFEQPHVEVSLAEGTSPTWNTATDEADAIGLTNQAARNTRIERIDLYTGKQAGPFKVISYHLVGDGAFCELGLQAVT